MVTAVLGVSWHQANAADPTPPDSEARRGASQDKPDPSLLFAAQHCAGAARDLVLYDTEMGFRACP